MIKFGRNYTISIQKQFSIPRLPSFLDVTLPFTIEFDIQRDTLCSASRANFRIYNLKESNRNAVLKNLNSNGDLRYITFNGGYGQNLSECFRGSIQQCFSYRESKVDMITELQCADGGYSYSNAPTVPIQTFPKDTDVRTQMIPALVKALPGNVTVGAIGSSVNGTLSRSNSFAEHPADVLKGLTGGPSQSGFFVDLGKAYILADNECLPPGGITQIDASSGLLETPIREQAVIYFPMLFEPRIIMGQKIKLVSSTNPILNHDYKVISLAHRGTISSAICGDAITTVGLYAPFTDTQLVTVNPN